ncbi:MAG: NAD(P)/FAD-dependent oxidoreductase [Candidatus Puniceispirillaceae bacterium]
MQVLVVGASHAGIAFADALRRRGFAGGLTIIDRLDGSPLERPPLSKGFLLAGDGEDEGFALRAPNWFAEWRITLLTGRHVAGLDAATKQVTFDDAGTLSYDRLVLATGATPRILPETAGMDRVFVLRDPDDARRLRAAMRPARSALVIGGGYIGLEVAASLTKAGKAVTVIEAAPRLLARVASPPVSAFYANRHRDAGVDIVTGTSVAEIRHRDGGFVGAILEDGRLIDADMLVVGIGVAPNTDLAEQAGLSTGNGIIIDSHMRTSRPDIYAIGDNACETGSSHGLRIESVHNAQEQAERAAAHIAGDDAPRRQAPWFWSDQYDVKLQSAGILPASDPALQHVTRAGRREGSFSVWSFAGENLVAVEAIGDPASYVLGKTCLEHARAPRPSQLVDAGFDLKAFVADKSVA